MKKMKKATALVLTGVMALSLAGCGSSGGSGGKAAGDDTSFTWWIYQGVDSSYYTNYEDGPALKYLLNKTYGPDNKKIDLKFWVPPAGTAVDNFSTMMGSGDYADIINNTIGDYPITMYEEGIILDLTDYVKEYMPNYTAMLEADPSLKADAVTMVDGEEKYLQIITINEDFEDAKWGPMYRRDWIVKYGTNPKTGQPFTGGFTDPEDVDSWEDDVVFPSGGTDPVYISDWEWMFEIFEKAYADLGLTDSYCTSIQFCGYNMMGELNSGFGGGDSAYWYRDLNNVVTFGPATDQFRSYLQCMSTWYEKGWLDPDFYQRTSDMFYQIDSTSVRQGKIGMWYGVQGQLGGRMDTGDALTDGICVYACANAVNDKYGDESTQYKTPYCGFGSSSLSNGSLVITTAAEGKDLATLLSFFDSLYTKEGALIRGVGLNKEQVEESGTDLYEEWGIGDGAYTVKEDGTYLLSPVIRDDSANLASAAACTSLPGLNLVTSVDKGYSENFRHSLDQWLKYRNYGFFQGTPLTATMTEEESDEYSGITTKLADYMTTEIPNYIRGIKDPYSDEDWNNLTKMLGKYNYQKLSDIVQPYADARPIVLDEDFSEEFKIGG